MCERSELLINFNSLIMSSYAIKTYKKGTDISKPHFYILNKGLNSGKPLKNPCPNCYVLTAKTEEKKEFYYWITFGLWQSKSFYPYLRGSVIPFIIIGEFKKLIVQASYKALINPDKFNKAIISLKQLDLLEKKYQKNLQMIKQARQLIFYKYGG